MAKKCLVLEHATLNDRLLEVDVRYINNTKEEILILSWTNKDGVKEKLVVESQEIQDFVDFINN